MIKTNKIKKTFYKGGRTLEILKNISFTVEKGNICLITGKSGAGKSTLLHLLGLIDKADSGEIIINGKNISSLKSKKKSRYRNKNIGFIFQSHNLIMELTALENTALPAMISGYGKKEGLEKAENILKKAGLGERLNHKPFELSGGELQRVNLCRAFINSPELILADEPTGSLDYSTREEIVELMQKFQKDFNQTMIIVSHDESFSRFADITMRLEKGYLNLK